MLQNVWAEIDHRLEVGIEQQAVAMLKFISYVYAISFVSGIQLINWYNFFRFIFISKLEPHLYCKETLYLTLC